VTRRVLHLVYAAAPRYGGWCSFTSHLAHVLLALGVTVRLWRVGARHENKMRQWGEGLHYQNTTLDGLRAMRGADSVVVSAADADGAQAVAPLVAEGALVVVHDPTELKADALVQALRAAPRAPVCIRDAVAPHVRAATGHTARVLPHPYARAPGLLEVERDMHAVSMARLDWDKHTDIVVRANAALPQARRVVLYGAENRLYTHHRLATADPAWREQYRGAFPRTAHAAARLAARAGFVVDMSAIAGDGGGTQYTFLEAWDAGAVLVVNAAWSQVAGVVSHNGTALAVATPEELVRVLREEEPRGATLRALRVRASAALAPHTGCAAAWWEAARGDR